MDVGRGENADMCAERELCRRWVLLGKALLLTCWKGVKASGTSDWLN
jgi:hypothetical protein